VVIQLLEAPDTTDPIGLRDRAILEVFYASGLRRNELRSLTLQDLDFHKTSIRVEKGKGDKQRIVPAGQRAFGWIRSYLETTRPLLAASKAPTAPLFVTGYGDAFSAGGLGHLVRRYLDQIGVTIVGGPHLLRHSAATHMMDRGAGLRAIQRILGHSRLDTTAIYTHVSTDQLREIHARCHPLGDQAAIENTERSGSPEASQSPASQDLVD
jgi:integrase/recombinase XerD